MREATLVKEKKLPPVMGAQVEARFVLIRTTLQLEPWEERLGSSARKGVEGTVEEVAEIDARLVDGLKRVDRYSTVVREANEPRLLDEGAAEILVEIANTTFTDPDGNPRPYITAEELH